MNNLLPLPKPAVHPLDHPQQEQVYHQKAIAIYQQLNQTTLLATELSNLSKAYHKIGIFETAHSTLKQVLAPAQQINDLRNQAFTLSNLGIVADYQLERMPPPSNKRSTPCKLA